MCQVAGNTVIPYVIPCVGPTGSITELRVTKKSYMSVLKISHDVR